MLYAEILPKQKISQVGNNTLTYAIPEQWTETVKPGQQVKAPLRNKTIAGTILKIHSEKPAYNTREISELIGETPLLSDWQLRLVHWISERYICPLYKALSLFIPEKIFTGKKLREPKATKKSPASKHTPSKPLIPTPEQQHAIDTILNSPQQTFLVHGITGSGKTEIYLRLAQHFSKQEKQSLILVPEISLTPQFLQYFQESFGDTIAVIHSKVTITERARLWQSIRDKKIRVVIGSRSAIFSPFQNLALIVMDEEHEFSYKQENSPRYHTRDIIEKMSELLPEIKVVFGSATPSIETHAKATEGTYQLLELKNRIQSTPLPEVTIIDLRDELKKRNFSVISDLLQEKIQTAINNKEQVVLFLNRRGAASSVVCRECGYIVTCKTCETRMTYHKKFSTTPLKGGTGILICHHCGTVEQPPNTCPTCRGIYIKYLGIGTQRVEEEIHKLFPLARVIRADSDTTSKKGDFAEIYRAFRNHEADILIGTQMIGKGLHLPKVNLVGVILADLSLNFPDFRSSERTFQLLTQVAGRAGRDTKQGEVIIQTYSPDNFAIQCAKTHDYETFAAHEIQQRRTLNYPPFSELVKLTFAHKNESACQKEIEKMETLITAHTSTTQCEIFSYPALIKKLKNQYRYHILLKGHNLASIISQLDLPNHKGWKIDVNPISTL